MIVRLILICSCWLIAACSNTSRFDGLPQQLNFHILDNDSKQFVYRLETRVAAMPQPRARQRAQQQRRFIPDKHDYKRLRERTDQVVFEAGYCRKGYLELDFRLAVNVQWIRGECREGATAQDRERFGRQGEIAL